MAARRAEMEKVWATQRVARQADDATCGGGSVRPVRPTNHADTPLPFVLETWRQRRPNPLTSELATRAAAAEYIVVDCIEISVWASSLYSVTDRLAR